MQEIIRNLTSIEYFGNSAWQYTIATVAFIGGLLVLKFFQMIILAKLKKLAQRTKTDLDDTLVQIVQNVRPPFYLLIALIIATKYLSLPELADKIISIILILVIVFEVVHALEKLIVYSATKYMQRKQENVTIEDVKRSSMINAIALGSRVLLWSLGLLFVLSNLGINVNSLIASLGIGGIALAFALQNILTDLFSSFSIYFDEPFQVGDFIIAGTESGTVEKIGLKTTRLRTLRGEELVISNKDLTNARIQNLKKMERRREVLRFGVLYETPSSKLRSIPKMVREIVGKAQHATFDRCHFVELGDSALIYECVYHVEDTNYTAYLNAKQKINLALKSRFEKEEIEFAYPTQKVYISQE